MMFKKTLLAAALLAIGAIGTTAMAASPATATFHVSLTVVAACTVATPSDINLGTAPTGSGNDYKGSTTIAVTCPTGIPYTVGLLPSNGNASGAGVLTSSPNTIAYNLYSDTLYSVAWGNTTANMKAGTGNAAAQSLTAYVKVASAALASAATGSYTDAVTVNVNY